MRNKTTHAAMVLRSDKIRPTDEDRQRDRARRGQRVVCKQRNADGPAKTTASCLRVSAKMNKVRYSRTDNGTELVVDNVLFATGRSPNSWDLGLEEARGRVPSQPSP